MNPLDLVSWRLLVTASYSLALFSRQKGKFAATASLAQRVSRWYSEELSRIEKEGTKRTDTITPSELEEGTVTLKVIQSDCLLFTGKPDDLKKAQEVSAGLLDSLSKKKKKGGETTKDEKEGWWFALAHRQQGRCALAAGRVNEGVESYKRSLQAEGRKGFVWDELAQVYVHLGLKEAAELCYQQSVKMASGDQGRASRFVSQIRLAELLGQDADMTRCKDALFAINNALKVKEDSAPAYLLQGISSFLFLSLSLIISCCRGSLCKAQGLEEGQGSATKIIADRCFRTDDQLLPFLRPR